MKGAIYARESDDKVPIETQIEFGTNWFKENGHELVKVYADNDYSGGDWNRPEYNKVLVDSKPQGIEFIWVWAHDRIARDTEQFLSFHRKLKEVGVKIYANGDGWITMDNVGDKAKNIMMAASSEIYRTVTAEKIKDAYQAKKRQAEAKGEPVKWGRNEIPTEIRSMVLGIVMRDPKLGYRKIAALLPKYKVKTQEGEPERFKQPSYVWVKSVLDAKRKEQEDVKKTGEVVCADSEKEKQKDLSVKSN